MKRILVPLVLALFFAGAAYAVISNSHIDIFPCMKRPYTNDGTSKPMQSGTCDLLTVDSREGELTAAGYAVEGGVLLAALLIGVGLGRVLTRPKKA